MRVVRSHRRFRRPARHGRAIRHLPAFLVTAAVTNQWTSVAPLPTPLDHLAAVSVGGRIYVSKIPG